MDPHEGSGFHTEGRGAIGGALLLIGPELAEHSLGWQNKEARVHVLCLLELDSQLPTACSLCV